MQNIQSAYRTLIHNHNVDWRLLTLLLKILTILTIIVAFTGRFWFPPVKIQIIILTFPFFCAALVYWCRNWIKPLLFLPYPNGTMAIKVTFRNNHQEYMVHLIREPSSKVTNLSKQLIKQLLYDIYHRNVIPIREIELPSQRAILFRPNGATDWGVDIWFKRLVNPDNLVVMINQLLDCLSDDKSTIFQEISGIILTDLQPVFQESTSREKAELLQRISFLNTEVYQTKIRPFGYEINQVSLVKPQVIIAKSDP